MKLRLGRLASKVSNSLVESASLECHSVVLLCYGHLVSSMMASGSESVSVVAVESMEGT